MAERVRRASLNAWPEIQATRGNGKSAAGEVEEFNLFARLRFETTRLNLLLDPVFGLRFDNGLPLHIERAVGASALEARRRDRPRNRGTVRLHLYIVISKRLHFRTPFCRSLQDASDASSLTSTSPLAFAPLTKGASEFLVLRDHIRSPDLSVRVPDTTHDRPPKPPIWPRID